MASEPIYGQTLKQSLATERVCRDARVMEGSLGDINPGTPSPAFARLMTVGTTFPKYGSPVRRNAALFSLSEATTQMVVKFEGEELWGDVRLTIGPRLIVVDCRADTETLRSLIGFNLDYCRVTAFPGLWEFAFGFDVEDIPFISCEEKLTSNNVRFLGGCRVFPDHWRSVSANRDNYDTVKVIDTIPHLEGEVKLGSMALCEKIETGLYLAGQWSCPAFTFRSV